METATEADQKRAKVQVPQMAVTGVEAKVARKRIKIADLKDALQDAEERLAELQEQNDKFVRRASDYRLGKLLREVCDASAGAGDVLFTEYYMQPIATAVVLNPCMSFSRPRPAMTSRFQGSHDALITALLASLDQGILLQYKDTPTRWRDCFIAGPGDGETLMIKFVFYYECETPDTLVMATADRLRFADFVDEEDFFAKL